MFEKHGCDAIPSIHAFADSVFYLPIPNPLNALVEIAAGTPVAAIALVAFAPNSPSTGAMIPQLSRNDKLSKVLHELQIESLPDSTPHKRPLV